MAENTAQQEDAMGQNAIFAGYVIRTEKGRKKLGNE